MVSESSLDSKQPLGLGVGVCGGWGCGIHGADGGAGFGEHLEVLPAPSSAAPIPCLSACGVLRVSSELLLGVLLPELRSVGAAGGVQHLLGLLLPELGRAGATLGATFGGSQHCGSGGGEYLEGGSVHGTWKKTAPRSHADGDVGRGVVGGGTGPLGVYRLGKTLHVMRIGSSFSI